MTLMNHLFSLEKYSHASLFEGCEYPWLALVNLKKYFENSALGKIEVPIPEGVMITNPELVSIGKGTEIEPGAYIKGPCIIGENCQVRHGAYIRGFVIIGNDCVVGHATEVKESIFLDGACASHFNYVGNSILGNNVNLGAGLICANLKLDNKNVFVYLEEKKIDTSFKKLGALVGDGSQLGAQCVLNPGTVIGKNVFCYPLLKISGYILPNSIIRTSVQN
jgi:UDP-N-acetylglucosamine diphosphorylase / glucose-1-phosphate thymidylyltransferase / UDP-N-acetylgalactosamine diphosphorylase / glucosamine-1-phosphate N-acetyltransferase / galactosamine-1-phosphate N-acetyltransferase